MFHRNKYMLWEHIWTVMHSNVSTCSIEITISGCENIFELWRLVLFSHVPATHHFTMNCRWHTAQTARGRANMTHKLSLEARAPSKAVIFSTRCLAASFWTIWRMCHHCNHLVKSCFPPNVKSYCNTNVLASWYAKGLLYLHASTNGIHGRIDTHELW